MTTFNTVLSDTSTMWETFLVEGTSDSLTEYSSIQSQVLALLGRDDDKAKALILQATNIVQNLLATAGDWEDLERTQENAVISDGVDLYVLRSLIGDEDFVKILTFQLYDDDRWQAPLDYVTPTRWDESFGARTTTTNRPEIYTLWQRTIKVYPEPDQDYVAKFRYYAKPDNITGDTDELSYDSFFDPMIIQAVTGFVWAGLEELDLAEIYMKMADGFLRQFKGFDAKQFNFSAFISTKHQMGGQGSNPWANPFINNI